MEKITKIFIILAVVAMVLVVSTISYNKNLKQSSGKSINKNNVNSYDESSVNSRVNDCGDGRGVPPDCVGGE